jgi:hypothetical protein
MDTSVKDEGRPSTLPSSAVADDALIGFTAIAAELGMSKRQAMYLLEKGLIPLGKLGGRYVVSKRRLREHFDALAAGGIGR